MKFQEIQVRGLSKCLVGEGVDPNRLRIHVSEIAAGTSAHPPHAHQGTEAFYVLEGSGSIQVEGERHELATNEVIVLDATREHGLSNTGTTRMRYVVIITQ